MCEGETERGNREWMIEEDKGERATKALIRRLITNRPAQSDRSSERMDEVEDRCGQL